MSVNPMDVLGDLATVDGLADPVGPGGGDVVRCQACLVDLDPATGQPLSPVTEENVRALEEYVLGSGSAEMGGQQLELGGPPAF